MDGFTWLILSWITLATICYFGLYGLGSKNNTGGTATSQFYSTSTSPYSSTNSEWANEVLAWMYNNFHKIPAPLDAWIRSLNDAAKKVSSPTKCEVLFEGFGDHSTVTQAPQLSNVRVEHGPRDHLTLRSNIHLPCVNLKLVSSQRTQERLVVSNFHAQIIDLRGEVEARIACIANQLYFMGCFNGRPEMDVQLTNTDPRQAVEVNNQLVEEAIRRCLLSAVTNINLSESGVTQPGDRRSSSSMFAAGYAASPSNHTSFEEQRSHSPGSTTQQAAQEMFRRLNQTHLAPTFNQNTIPNKLRVKVIKAQRLGKGYEVQQPYAVIEMDEPAKKAQTSLGLNVNPYWEESFDFDLTPASEEILFELYEGSTAQQQPNDEKIFLGLAIVGFEEIRRSGETIHTLTLTGRPYRNDLVSGTLTVQFDFYYDATVETIGKHTDSVVVRNSNGSEFRETVTTQNRTIYDPHDHFDLHDVTPSKTTTVFVKSVKHEVKDKPLISSVHGSMENAMEPPVNLDRRIVQEAMRPYESPVELQPHRSSDVTHPSRPSPQPELRIFTDSDPDRPIDERKSRDRTKKNGATPEKRESSFFGQLRDRLSGRRRSQKRAQSMEAPGELEEAVSLPPSRDQSQSRYSERGRSYFETSSVGGRSGESARSLYQHSTLVLELAHNNQKKYYLIPPAVAQEPAAARLMRRGKKLHIYNEHTFVAVKIRGGTVCNVCRHRIARSFTKQAYQCRDCRLVCHKSCHYKTESFCTQSNVAKLDFAKDVDWAHFLSHYQLEEFISLEGV